MYCSPARIFPVTVTVANPSSVITSVKGPGAIFANANSPALSLTTSASAETAVTSRTCAPDTIAPVTSFTTPEIVPASDDGACGNPPAACCAPALTTLSITARQPRQTHRPHACLLPRCRIITPSIPFPSASTDSRNCNLNRPEPDKENRTHLLPASGAQQFHLKPET